MSDYRTRPKADEDLIEGARWIRADNSDAARRFLDAAFEACERLAQFPESGALARFKNHKLTGVSAVIYTLLDHCRHYVINPFDYVKDLFMRLPAVEITKIKEFTPPACIKAKAQFFFLDAWTK